MLSKTDVESKTQGVKPSIFGFVKAWWILETLDASAVLLL